MAHGWYLSSAPIITANWLAAGGEKWTVPVGGGFDRVFRVGDQPVNASIEAYYNVERPTGAVGMDVAHLGRASVPGEITNHITVAVLTHKTLAGRLCVTPSRGDRLREFLGNVAGLGCSG